MSDQPTGDGLSSSRHTPGPWEIGGVASGGLGRNRIIEASRDSEWSGSGVAEVFGVRDPNCVANARLIAAAPDMLEALKAANRYLADIAANGGPRSGADGLNDWSETQCKIANAIIAATADGSTPGSEE